MVSKKKQLFTEDYIKTEVYKAPLFETEGIRLYMNENVFGPSNKCLEAARMINNKNLFEYESGGNLSLINELSVNLGIPSECFIVTTGSSMGLFQLFFATVEKGDCIFLPNPGWSYYKGILGLAGANIHLYQINKSKERFYYDTGIILSDALKYDPKLVIITSPNMPTGNSILLKDLELLLSQLPNSLIVLDEAYYGFDEEESINYQKLLQNHDNLIIVRTFSKFYGLANARVGYIIGCPTIIRQLSKSNDLFGISGISQKIAIASLQDKEYYNNLKQKIIRIRDDFIMNVNNKTNFTAYSSKANFILINTKNTSAEYLVRLLKEKGYLVRDCITYGMKNYIRITIGMEDSMNGIFMLLKENS